MKKFIYALLVTSAYVLPASVWAADDDLGDLGNLSLESLGNVVTSVSKKPEDSFRAAAAIYVITNEDIKLSGATHIAEVLRGVPGFDVAQIDSSSWAVSSRGFNDAFSNKLLVLVDGRTIYTPLFSGVYWDIQNMPLEDIQRVEVIRGPGATLWGANAVNGVINIITKSAADTQGAYLNQVVGTHDRSLTDVRYGTKLDDNAYIRAYAKYDARTSLHDATGANANNSWENAKVGFRSDLDINPNRKITVQGDAYSADINLNLLIPDLAAPAPYYVIPLADKIHSKGFNVLGKWEEKHNADMQSSFQAYVDYQSPSYSSLKQQILTSDFDYQTALKVDNRNDVTWGAGVRYIAANFTDGNTITTLNSHVTQQIYSAFLQDQIALIQKELYLTLGTKIEYNSLVGTVPEPSVRVSWYPDNKQTVWAAVSHAVRTPSIAEKEFTGNIAVDPFGAPSMIQQQYNKNFESEELTAYEIGYRIKPTQKLGIDLTAYMNDYSRLSTFDPLTPTATTEPFTVSNFGSGQAYGFEASATWDVTANWNLLANYSYINMVLDQGDSLDLLSTFKSQEGRVPHNQFMLRSQLFLPHDVQLINTGYYVDKLPSDSIGSYLRFDTQIIWKPSKDLELAIVGQNLLDNHHPEFGGTLNGTTNEIPRAFYGRVSVRF